MTRTRTDQRRDRAERALERHLAKLAEDPKREPWLPMPCPRGARLSKLTYKEWYEYRRRRTLHDAEVPEYEAGWQRPTPETADDVWRTLGLVGVNRFLPPFARSHNEKHAARRVVMQATVVILDTIVRAGRRDQPHGQPRNRRLLTRNAIFDAVAGHWSDHYRLARTEGRAHHAREMTEATVTASWRDLVQVGLLLAQLWRFVKTLTRLYRLTPVNERSGRKVKSLGYAVTLGATPLLDAFERLIHADPDYRPRWREDESRVLFDADVMPPRPLRQRICAERAYSVVPLGPRAEQLLQTLERTRLVFDTPEFLGDYADPPNADWLAQYRRIYEQVRVGVPPYVDEAGAPQTGRTLIKAQYFRALNGRWHARHFWPTEVTGRRTRVIESTIDTGFTELTQIHHYSERYRWFPWVGQHEPAGFDVSSSQTQVLAILTGNDELEARAIDSNVPFKRYLAQVAWELFKPAGYEDANDKRLVGLVKDLWMPVVYGSRIGQAIHYILKDQASYGPGLAPRTGNVHRANVGRAEQFFDAIPGAGAVKIFLEACRSLADHADPYDGVRFVDPFDGVEFRWNPVQSASCRVRFDDFELFVERPGTKSRANRPNAAGDYPIDRKDLRDKVAPCLVHRLDSYFAGLVIERLAAAGVTDVVSLHDCWLVPADALDVLKAAIADAGQEWLRGLAPVYDRLIAYLGTDPRYGPFVHDIRAQWAQRVQTERWPVFAVKRDVLWEQEDGYGRLWTEEELLADGEDRAYAYFNNRDDA